MCACACATYEEGFRAPRPTVTTIFTRPPCGGRQGCPKKRRARARQGGNDDRDVEKNRYGRHNTGNVYIYVILYVMRARIKYYSWRNGERKIAGKSRDNKYQTRSRVHPSGNAGGGFCAGKSETASSVQCLLLLRVRAADKTINTAN